MYFGGMILLAIVGSVVQWKLFRSEDDEDEKFADEEEAKCCGLF